MIAIEKGVDIPSRRVGRSSVYPWNIMEVGDSFLVTGNPSSYFHVQVYNANKRYAPKRFVQRIQEDCSVRVWRVA